MADEKDCKEVNMARVELYWGQEVKEYGAVAGRYLNATVVFKTPEFHHKGKTVLIGAKQAALKVSFQNCEMKLRHANYSHNIQEQHDQELARKRQLKTKGQGSMKAKAKAGLSGVGLSGEVGGCFDAEKAGVTTVTDRWKHSDYAVNFVGEDDDTLEWKLLNPRPGANHIEGQIIGEADQHGGCLGRVTLEEGQRCTITPDVALTAQTTIVVDDENLGLIDKQKLKLKNNVLTAIVNKKLKNTPQKVYKHIPRPTGDQPAPKVRLKKGEAKL